MKLILATPAFVSAWVQPAWKDVQAALNNADNRGLGRQLDWGHPIEGDAKKWYHCPALTKPGKLDYICKNPFEVGLEASGISN